MYGYHWEKIDVGHYWDLRVNKLLTPSKGLYKECNRIKNFLILPFRFPPCNGYEIKPSFGSIKNCVGQGKISPRLSLC